jgi:hypothetical protein
MTSSDARTTSPAPETPTDLRQRLQAAELELARARSRVAALEASSAYRLGSAFVQAARHPRRAPITVSREMAVLYRRWRLRSRKGTGPVTEPVRAPGRAAAAGPRSAGRDGLPVTSSGGTADLLGSLSAAAGAATLGPRSTAVVAAVAHPGTVRALGEHLLVTALAPNGGRQALERIAPDLLFVDATATGTGGWAGLGRYTRPWLEHRLAELLELARAAGITSVLWDPLGPARVPALHEVLTFDVVLTPTGTGGAAWTPGVRMADHYTDPAAPRPVDLLAVDDLGMLAAPGAAPLVDALARLVPAGLRVASDEGFAAVPQALRAAAVDLCFRGSPWSSSRIAVPLRAFGAPRPATDDLAAALTAGARVVAGPVEGDLAAFSVVVEGTALASAARTALEAGPWSPEAHRTVLGAVFAGHSTYRGTRRLLDLTGITAPAALAAAGKVTVVAEAPPDAAAADALLGALLAQRERPAALVVAAVGGPQGAGEAGAETRLEESAAAAGLPVCRVPGVDGQPWWHEAARRAPSRWVYVLGAALPGPQTLLDLLAVREATAADAVGTAGSGSPATVPRPVADLPLAGALVAREILLGIPVVADGVEAQRIRRGHLVAVSPAPDDEARA